MQFIKTNWFWHVKWNLVAFGDRFQHNEEGYTTTNNMAPKENRPTFEFCNDVWVDGKVISNSVENNSTTTIFHQYPIEGNIKDVLFNRMSNLSDR